MHKRIALGVALGGFLLLVLDAVAVRIGVAPGAIPKLAGTSLWVTSRAAGVTAFLALTLDVVFGLFVSTGAADRLISRARSIEVHRWLSTVALTMTGVHALALLGDRFVRFDVLDLLIPFLSSYRSFAVALGVLAAYGALIVHESFSWRKRIGAKTWRRLHYVSFFVFAASLLHGLLAGSDSGTPGMLALYVSSATLVGVLGAYRALNPRGARVQVRRR
ncbi:MAG: ferric reductase-like transmembrane domain-containing protein [Polyangiaceae bacterium]|nr:ferric reductase-like transmembrane domain-containing protein [Polyangiaceae bacterium]